MERVIKISSEACNSLAKTFKVTTRTVQNATSGNVDSEQNRKIRNSAVKSYAGKYIKMMPQKGVTTIHEDSVITHYFYGTTEKGERKREMSLVLDTESGTVKEYEDGIFLMKYKNVSVSRVNSIIKDVCNRVGLDYNEYFPTL